VKRKESENKNVKRSEDMARNSNPRTQSVKDAMLAEIIVTELSKFSTSHEAIMESTEKILSRYNEIGLLIERMNERDQAIVRSIKDLQLSSEQYQYLTKLSIPIARKLKEIDEHGIRIEPGALDKITSAVEQGNNPLLKQIKWVSYGLLTGFVILLLILLF
jgi:nicotinic acid phosphoribosyltransferase